MIAPRATYRLQLNKDFTFADAAEVVPYLDELGISHVYLSPILKAHAGSTHGYDTVDHQQINPELGTLEGFRALAKAIAGRDMGIILDFVPNHMGVGGADNALWLDVLKHGKASRFADWFDIDWQPPRTSMAGKVLVPVLGGSYLDCLTVGDIRLKADGNGFAVWAYDREKLPIRDEDAARLLDLCGSADRVIAACTGQIGHAQSWAELDRLIALQHWRLAHFSTAADEINYRRFFINSELAGIRIDRPEVFEHAHALMFALIAEGLVDGLRIDHVDGLLDPRGYLDTLRARVPRPIYLVVEKILAPHETLRADWPVEGTTGYEVGVQLTRVLTRADGEAAVTAAYADFTGDHAPFQDQVHACKLAIMDNELAAELAGLARQVAAIAWSVEATADLTEGGLRKALRETMAQLSVYRTYGDDAGLSPRDRREIRRAIAQGRRRQPHIQPMIFDFIERLFCGDLGAGYHAKAIGVAIGKIQQLSGPVMAKGLEDTALYRYNRLISLNEVGAHPDRFALSVGAFHDSNVRRMKQHPQSMIATSTHDTKRGEDMRAVIAAIADEPELWTDAVARWRSMLTVDGRDPLHPNDLYLFFQLLLGGWPLSGDAEGLMERIQATMQKSLREARLRSDWGVNDTAYEARCDGFVECALADEAFIADFKIVAEPLRHIGRRKALIQAALKLTIPGVPDIYRGAESWEQSFVDPDNRRALDFADLASRLGKPRVGADDKLILTQRLLELRCRLPLVFSEGRYEAIDCGPDTLGFRRRHDAGEVVVLVDLSRGHGQAIAAKMALPTVHGGSEGPVWIMARAGA